MSYISKIQFLVLVVCIGIFSSCRRCDEKIEPYMQVSFYNSGSNVNPNSLYTKVSVLGLDKFFSVDSSVLNLPINPKATEMTYIFEGYNRIDTLRYTYRVEYGFENSCKYTNDVTNIMLDSASTFNNVTFSSSNYYTSNTPYAQITL